ncbi:MAG: homoserine O-acetyltransferase [Pseudomonadota bacterium]
MHSQIASFSEDTPLALECGEHFAPFQIAYQTYGELNQDKSNAILICHALTGDQHAANIHPLTTKSGWWNLMVGPGKPIDTDRYFVICSNILGGCMGSTGPGSINPKTNTFYGPDFPLITIPDMVGAQAKLIEHLGIDTLFSVIGGSMGGMQVLEWATRFKNKVFSAIPIAACAQEAPQNIGFHEVCRQAIMADPDWRDGHYLEHNTHPKKGLAVARMAAHIGYLSKDILSKKFGRNLQDRDNISFGFDADFQVESYLRHQGNKFVERFDANSYLYISRAIDYFDLPGKYGGLVNAFAGTKTRFCVISFTSDWLQPTSKSREIVRALNAVAAKVSFVEIETDKGHDAFLLDEPELFMTISGFLEAAAKARGLNLTSVTAENVRHIP